MNAMNAMNAMSVSDALTALAANDPDRLLAIDRDGTSHRARDLRKWANGVRDHVAALARPEKTVLLRVAPGGAAVAGLIGVTDAGCHAALVPDDAPTSTLERARSELHPALDMRASDAPRAGSDQPRGDGSERGGVILLSSGTTGRSRFILRSAAALDGIARGLVHAGLYSASDRVVSFLPVHHAYGLEHALLAPLLAHACVDHRSEFAVETVSEALAVGGTVLPLSPVALATIARERPSISGLRLAISAGSVLAPSIRAMWSARVGVPLVDLYGATELGTMWLDHGQGGIPMPGVEVRVVQSGDPHGASAPDGSEGELWVRSATHHHGIYGSNGMLPADLADGWFATGDLGVRNARGGFQITGRSKLVFDVGGLKVNPIDVESELASHPAVAASLVLPMWLDGGLCRVGAQVELVPGAPTVSAEALRAHVAARVPTHAVPRSLELVSSLPRSASGKVLRPAAATAEPMAARAPVVERPEGLGRRLSREQWTRELFNNTSPGYNNSSGAAFLGLGRRYRRRMLRQSGLGPGQSMLDVGSGTGLCAWIGQQMVGLGGRVVALDPSEGMLEQARRRGVRECVHGFAEALPFDDASFDLVTMSYMLRHVDDLAVAFAQARRVLRPGGRILIFELTSPARPSARWWFRHAMRTLVPAVGVIASARPSTFKMMRYWGDTIDAAVRPEQIEAALRHAGFTGVRHQRNLNVFSCYRGVCAS